ncbi:protein-L-isoaspartate O-methyltransferase domain-containing protein 1-like isoform X1 [Diorhabda carinulata]|uniref:protein-L-isoaspartate O-methyltransferase domain-containing protein 1-like isoform X1 n=1 Tax=Diorhabda carinulata TaxID=1163345 RepID=UPI0025A18440|nr:protein-L-isoaspartate O-methyltransferase domain-containing protein 1-like isoform X1 [Diorhabda carinulata]
MGGVVSSGQNNDDLIDNLLEADYIKTPLIERVFRAVDRAEYFLPEGRANAYKDLAWKFGNLHLSAPCIYSEVMEGLCLKPGLSFLNLGSGTGYLSTMVGLIIGHYGINHGIEYHNEVVQYANKKLEDFKKYSGSIDEFDYCEPKFIQGNCLCLTTECNAQYDRVYCGAACPEQYASYMKNLLKIGGILVMPLDDQLMQIKRSSETSWEVKSLLPVSFASLIQPTEGKQDWVQLMEIEPQSLQVLCRATIRNILRKNVEIEHPPVKRQSNITTKAPKRKRALRRLVVPLFDSEDSSDDERHVRISAGRNRDGGRASFREDNGGFFNFVLGSVRDGRTFFSASLDERNNSSGRENNTETELSSEDNRMETDTAESTEECNKKPKIETEAVIEHRPSTRNEESTNGDVTDGVEAQNGSLINSMNEIHNVFVDVINVLRNESDVNSEEEPRSGPSEEKKKREKFDSGLGEDIAFNHAVSSEDDTVEDARCSSDEEGNHNEKGNKRSQLSENKSSSSILKWRRIESDIQGMFIDSSSSSDNENDTQRKIDDNDMRMYKSPYTEHMKAKIQQLPLPTILKKYINYYRDF